MPKRKRRGASLGLRPKGRWKQCRPSVIASDNNEAQSDSITTNLPTTNSVGTQDQDNNNGENHNQDPNEQNVENQDNVAEADDTFQQNIHDRRRQKIYFKKLRSISRRWAIFDLFVYKYNGLDCPDGDFYAHWQGRNGLASKIRKDLKIKANSGYKMVPIFDQILECMRTERDFDPRLIEKRGGQRPVTFTLQSPEAQIVADGVEAGLSIKQTWNNVNWHRSQNGEELVSKSCIISLLRRMQPKIVKISKRKQGSTDPDSHWSQARKAWSTQLLVRLGELKPEELPHPVEKRFHRDSLGAISLHQIVWWDETHRKCLIGGLSSSKDFTLLFKRDKNGKLDLKNGEYSKKKVSILNVKYEKECRLGLGCAMVAPLDPDGNALPVEGRRCVPFDYTGKVIISIPDYEKGVASEIARVKKLSANSRFWVSYPREKGKLYEDDLLRKLNKCGSVSEAKLNVIGLMNVGDVKKLKEEAIKHIALPKGISKTNFRLMWEHAQQDTIPGVAPLTVDHRQAPNPYLSKYGQDWEKYIKKSATFSTSVVITDYIEHIMFHSQQTMEGTKHSGDWLLYHDALSIMTAERTKQWMDEKNYLKRWVLPSNDLYDNMPEVKNKYKNNPLGNSPEFMPWDAHLNQDVHSSVDFHSVLTKHLADEDPRKFDTSTPKKMSAAYRRILCSDETGVSPPSRRIIQDVSRVPMAFREVMWADGCLIAEQNMRQGRRFERLDTSSNWGGKRKKKGQHEYIPPANEIHHSVRDVVDGSISLSLERASGCDNARIPINEDSDKNKNYEEFDEANF